MSEEIKLNEDIKKVVKTPLIITSAKEMKRLEQENERLHTIIKEVRKYIERRDIDWGSKEHDHVLEMLDKEIKE